MYEFAVNTDNDELMFRINVCIHWFTMSPSTHIFDTFSRDNFGFKNLTLAIDKFWQFSH